MLLSALGIFFVVDMHAGSPFGIFNSIFNSIFNYESFFMQMFVFISGYFFKTQNLKTPFRYIWRNTKKLILPYLVINLFYLCLIMLAKLHNPQIQWHTQFSLLDQGRDTVITLPAWFVPMLYFVIITYTLLRLIFKKWHTIPAFCIFTAVGTLAVYLSKTDFNCIYTVLLLKIAFFLQFFEMGVLYKSKIETHFKKTSKFKLILLCTFINIFFIAVSQNNIGCKYLYKMGGFLTDIYILPLITAVTGICFWLCITEWLAPPLQKIKIINYISSHTFAIMFHHIFFFTAFSYILSKIPFETPFDYEQFYENAGWYKYPAFEGVKFLYVIFAFAGCLLLCFIWDKIKNLTERN